jgi:hypothetical protein
MIQRRSLSVLAVLSTVVAACGSGGSGSDPGASPEGAGGMGAGSGGNGAMAGTGVGGAGGAALPPGSVITTCTPGIPKTSQIPRLLNRQYDAVVKDLLGVTTVGPDAKLPSQLLVADSDDGPMTADAWRIYQDVGQQVARAVMTGPNKSRFIGCDPAATGCLDQTIKTFGRKAFRRPLTDLEVARFTKLGATTPPGTPAEVAETVLQAFLVSPSFLLLPELTTTKDPSGTAIQLSSHEVASRLAFLLWGSVPDDTLNSAADSNELQTKEQILTQAKRMIAVRERTGPLVASFHRNWVQMDNGNAHWWKIDHDPKVYPLFSTAAKPLLQAELDAFFQEVAFAGGSFQDLLLSNVAFVNRDTAPLYGLDPAAYGADLTKVQLDAAQRPGFMTRAGFLGSYANYDSTSPILRGAFVSVYMLGVNPGPPIPGATMMTASGNFKTQREYVEALTKPSPCSGCHSGIINPPGFVLENFDGIGKWQTVDPRGGAIDAAVTTATVNFGDGNTKQISSPAQLMQEIALTAKAKQLYAQAWVSYAFGRAPNTNDQCVVEQLNTKLSQGGYTILTLLADLTQADSLRLRVAATP